jgi:hypothetical protein
MFNS